MSRNKNAVRLDVETLEGRLTPSGNPVTVVQNDDYVNPIGRFLPTTTKVTLEGSTIRIEGGDNADNVNVMPMKDAKGVVTYQVTNVIATDKGQKLKKEVFSVKAATITSADPKIVFIGNKGDDYFQYKPSLFVPKSENVHIFADGGPGKDNLFGSMKADLLIGGSEDDWIRAQGGDDILIGGGGVDHLRGGPGNDILLGGAGQDNLQGDGPTDLGYFSPTDKDGDDILDGGQDGVSDVLAGGKGRNLYVNDLAPVRPGIPLLQNLDTPIRINGETQSFTNNSVSAAITAVFQSVGVSHANRVSYLKGSPYNRILDDAPANHVSKAYDYFFSEDFKRAFPK